MIEREDQDQEKPEEKVQEGPKDEDRFVPTEQREELELTRRSEEDRRQSEDLPPDGEDRRETPERRLTGGHPEMNCGIIYRTTGGMTLIEDWLDEQCQGATSLVLTGLDDDMIKKSFKILFELENDKINFVENFIKK